MPASGSGARVRASGAGRGGGGAAGAGIVTGGVAASAGGAGGLTLVPGSSKSRSCGLPTELVVTVFVSCVCAAAVPPVSNTAKRPTSTCRGLMIIAFKTIRKE